MSFETVPLGSVVRIVNGGTPDTKVAAYWDGGIAWLTPKDMGKSPNPVMRDTGRTISARGLDNSSARLVPPWSVILSTRAPIGHLAINDVEMAFNQGCRGLVPGNRVDFRFLYHFLFANVSLLNDLGTGTTFKELSAGALANVPMPLPPLSEQLRIVAILDEAFKGIATAERNVREQLRLYGELKRSILAQGLSGELTGTDNSREQAANILAFIYWRHECMRREKTFGRVKGQKALDLVERVAGVDLGRSPYKYAAGPHDEEHMAAAQDWAKNRGFFEFVKRQSGGYDFKKLSNYEALLSQAKADLKPIESPLNRIGDLLAPMDTTEAEVFATVLAAWNNLIVEGHSPTETAILREAREDWHPDKATIDIAKFREAIRRIRAENLVPDGSAKPVRHKQTQLL